MLLTILISILFFILVLSTAFESAIAFSIILFAGFCLFGFLEGKAMLFFMLHHWKLILFSLFGYFIMGGAWSLFKWYRLNILIRDSYEEYHKSGVKLPQIKEYIRAHFGVNFPPKASEHKKKFIFWISSWPFSIVSWVLKDLMIDICNRIYKLLEGLYTNITKHVFKDIDLSKQQNTH